MKSLWIFIIPWLLVAQEKIEIYVDGMHCPLCTTAIKKALKGVEGVEQVNVTLEKKLAVVLAHDGIKDETWLAAVKTTGYEGVIRSRTSMKH